MCHKYGRRKGRFNISSPYWVALISDHLACRGRDHTITEMVSLVLSRVLEKAKDESLHDPRDHRPFLSLLQSVRSDHVKLLSPFRAPPQ